MKRRGKLLDFLRLIRFHTTFRLHNRANKFTWHRRWHDFKFAHHFHILLLAIYVLSIFASMINPQAAPKANAAAGSWSQTAFNGTSDGTYTNTKAANTNADISLKNSLPSLPANTVDNGNGTWTTTLQPDGTTGQDTRIQAYYPTTTDGTNQYLYVGYIASNDQYSSFLRFTDLSNIPIGSTVSSVQLDLYETGLAPAGSATLNIYKVLKNWSETDATWNVYASGSNWSTAGAIGSGTDINGSTSATISITTAYNHWHTVASTANLVSDVQSWVNGTVNNGWKIYAFNTGRYTAFASSDNSTVGNRPKLTVTYTPGASSQYVSSGTYTTAAIGPAGLYGNWGTLNYTTIANGQTITVDVLNGANNNVLATNVATGTNLNLSTATYSSIKLRANLSTADPNQSPLLNDWSVGYTTDVLPPTAPTGLIIGPQSGNSIPLSWTASTDADSGVASYQVSRAAESAPGSGTPGTFSRVGVSSGCYSTAVNSCSDNDPAIQANTKYFYQVKAIDNMGLASGFSGETNVDSNVVGLWHMNDAALTATDSSGNNNNLTLSTVSPWTANGKFSSAMSATINNYAYMNSNATLKPANFTIEAWFYATTDQNSKILVSKYAALPADYELSVDINDHLNIRSDNASNVSYYATDPALFTAYLNGWHHVAGTYDVDNKLRLYVDGNLVATSSAFIRANSRTDLFTIGRRAYFGAESPFTGTIDEVRLSNVARSGTDVQNYYNEARLNPKSLTTLTTIPILSDVSTPTNNNKPTITGTTTPNVTVRLFDRVHIGEALANAVATTTSDGSGNFTFSSSTPGYSALSDNDHVDLSAQSYNSNNDASGFATNISHLVIDTVKPTTVMAANPAAPNGSPDNSYYKTTPSITLNVSDATPSSGGLVTKWKWDSSAYQTYTGPITDLAEGTHILSFYSTDAVLNQEIAQTTTFKLDSASPVTTLTTNPVSANGNAGYFRTNPNITFSGLDNTSGLQKIEYQWSPTPLVALSDPVLYSTSFSIPADTSSNTLYYQATDNAGNVEILRSQVFKLDTGKPTSSIVTNPTPNNGTNGYFKSNPTITLSSGDAVSGPSNIRYQWSDTPLVSLTSPITYAGPFDMNSTAGQGTHSLYWQAMDVAGNVEDLRSQEFKLDSVAPVADSNSALILGDDSGFANGTTSGLVDLHLSATDTTSGMSKAVVSMAAGIFDVNSADCAFSYSSLIPNWDLNTQLCGLNLTGDGSKTVFVEFIDNAGNTTVVSKTITFDSTSPNNTTSVIAKSIPSAQNPDITSSEWTKYPNPKFEWDGASDDTAGVKDYYVYFGTDAGSDPQIATDATNLFYADNSNNNLTTQKSYIVTSTLVSGQIYYLKVKARDNALNLANNTYTENNNLFVYKYDSTAPTTINYIKTTPAGYSSTDSYSFEWDQVTDSFSTLDKYQYRKGDGVDTWHDVAPVPDPITGKISISNITKYKEDINKIQVKAIDKAGNETPVSEGIYYFAGNIAAPVNVRVDLSQSENQTVNRFSISWDKPDGVTPQGYYYSINAAPTPTNSVYVSYAGGTTTTIGPAPFATNQGLNTVQVVTKANDMIGWTNPSAAETFSCNAAAPGFPGNVMITDSSNRESQRWQLTVNWDQPTEVTPDFDRYVIERATDYDPVQSSGNFNQISTVVKPSADTAPPTGYLDTNLLNNVTYAYRIVASDKLGNKSAPSTVVYKQPSGRYSTPPNIIGSPKIEVQATKAKVTWTTDRNADSFVQIGATTDYGMNQGQLDSTSTHSVNISGLVPGSLYHFRSMWRDIDGNIGYSRDSTFKTQDAPGISEVTVSDIRLNSAIISWKSSTISTSKVLYGKSNSYGSLIEDRSASSLTVHVVKLDNLNHSSTYHFRVSGTDVDGNPLSSDDYSFETLTFPRISNVKLEQQKNSATSTVKVTWETNVPTSSIVEYLENGSNTPREVSRSTFELKHSILVGNLKDNTNYRIFVKARDSYGNEADAESLSYKTDFDTRPPAISNLTTEVSTTGFGVDAKGQVVVSWETDELATSQVEYDPGATADDTFSLKSKEDSTMTTSHVVILSDLKPSSAYHFRAVGKDASGNEGRSEGETILTEQATSSVLDVIIKSLQNSLGWLFGGLKG